MLEGQKRAQETGSVMIFILLALIVAGLIVFFVWRFVSTGVGMVDAADPTVQIAVESCRLEIQRQPSSYCWSEKKVKLKAGGEMIVSCHYIDNNVKKDSVSDGISIPEAQKNCEEKEFISKVCQRVISSEVLRDAENTIVNGQKCKNYYGTLPICTSGIDGTVNDPPCKCVSSSGDNKLYNICLKGQKCDNTKTEVGDLCSAAS